MTSEMLASSATMSARTSSGNARRYSSMSRSTTSMASNYQADVGRRAPMAAGRADSGVQATAVQLPAMTVALPRRHGLVVSLDHKGEPGTHVGVFRDYGFLELEDLGRRLETHFAQYGPQLVACP